LKDIFTTLLAFFWLLFETILQPCLFKAGMRALGMTAFLYVSYIWRLVQLLNKSSQSSKHVLVITNPTSSIGRYINGISVVSNTLLRGVFHNQGSCALDASFSPHCPQVFNIPTGTIRYCALHARTSRALTRVKLAPLTSVQIATLFSWPGSS